MRAPRSYHRRNRRSVVLIHTTSGATKENVTAAVVPFISA
jgi:hypothetical protein